MSAWMMGLDITICVTASPQVATVVGLNRDAPRACPAEPLYRNSYGA